MAFTDYAMIQEQQRKIELLSSPVVLRLRHVGKSYAMAKSADRVVALKDMHLCEDDEAPPDSTSGDRISSCINSTNMAMVDENGKAALPSFGPIRRGEFVMIRGPSGGGKTTLLNIIGAIDSCTEGSVELNGDTINAKTSASHLSGIRLRTLGFVFQTFNLIATMTAAENVELPMTLMGNRSHAEIQIRARQLLALVGLRNRVNHLPSELSGGEQQRVTIARSLSNNPAVLLLDEPTGDLDTANTIDVMNLLVRLNRCTKTTCIMVTHNPDIECYADRILYVSDGRFVREVHNDRPSQLDPKLYSKYLDQRDDITTMTTNLANHTGEGGKVKQTQGSTAVVAATVPREEQQQSFSVSV